eukprot:5445701-Pleurochrysis_carterae.AAC.3
MPRDDFSSHLPKRVMRVVRTQSSSNTFAEVGRGVASSRWPSPSDEAEPAVEEWQIRLLRMHD